MLCRAGAKEEMVSATQGKWQVNWGWQLHSVPSAGGPGSGNVAVVTWQRMPQVLERAEGCWAWVVLLASLVTQGLTLGFPTCTGIFFTELQHEFQASNSETSWFPSILTAMLHAGGEQPGEGPREG